MKKLLTEEVNEFTYLPRLLCLYHVLPESAFRRTSHGAVQPVVHVVPTTWIHQISSDTGLSSTDAYSPAMGEFFRRAVTTAERLSDQRWRHVKRGSLNSSVNRPTMMFNPDLIILSDIY